MPVPRWAAVCQMPNTAPIGSEAIASRPASAASRGPTPTVPPRVPDHLRREVHVVRREVRRPGDGEVAVRRQLADAGHLLAVEQGPYVRAELLRAQLELPAEQLPVEVLGRRQAVHHQTHPAGCAGRVPGRRLAVPVGRLPCLGHRHSLLDPSRWPCHFRCPPRRRTCRMPSYGVLRCVRRSCRAALSRAGAFRADARTTRGTARPGRADFARPRPEGARTGVSRLFPLNCRKVHIGCTACARSRTPCDRTCPAGE